MIKGHGFIPDTIALEDYVLGGLMLSSEVIQSNGQWDDYLPVFESQRKNGLETQNCTAYGTLNCLEVLMNRLFGWTSNFSERYVGIMAETTQNGNSPHKVIQVIRKESGLIDEDSLPFSEEINTWDKYYSPKPMDAGRVIQGRAWLRKFKIGHEWVFTGGEITEKQERLKEALKYSPVGVSVYAWLEGEGGIYVKPANFSDNHWVTLYGYEYGKHWKIFDSYDNSHKKLTWDYNFGYAKRFSIQKVEQTNKSWWTLFVEFINRFFKK